MVRKSWYEQDANNRENRGNEALTTLGLLERRVLEDPLRLRGLLGRAGGAPPAEHARLRRRHADRGDYSHPRADLALHGRAAFRAGSAGTGACGPPALQGWAGTATPPPVGCPPELYELMGNFSFV